MIKNIHALTLTIGLALGSLMYTTTSNAAPIFIEDEINGFCYLIDEDFDNYIYMCQNGATLLISKNTGGGGNGGGNDGGNDNCIICD